jgi:anaerobic selenocysteine-containing dehydrogenase
MPSTDRKLELKAKTSVAQAASQAAVYAKRLKRKLRMCRAEDLKRAVYNPTKANCLYCDVNCRLYPT